MARKDALGRVEILAGFLQHAQVIREEGSQWFAHGCLSALHAPQRAVPIFARPLAKALEGQDCIVMVDDGFGELQRRM